MTSERTGGKAVPLENVYGILPGTDEKLSKTVFIVSGHFDSMPSFKDIMDPSKDAPGADDDASGVAVSMEWARGLSDKARTPGWICITLLPAARSGADKGFEGSPPR